MDDFGARIKAVRKSKHISQAELSKLSNVSQTNISKLERTGSIPSLSTAKRLADALGVQLSDLKDQPPQVCETDLTEREREMFVRYRQLSIQEQDFIYDAIICVANKREARPCPDSHAST